MTVQLAAFVITAFWIGLSFWSVTSPVRRKNPRRPSISRYRTVSIILLEAATIIAAFTHPRFENSYIVAFGSSFLVIGWIISNNNILVPYYNQKTLLRLRDWTFSLLGIHRDFYYLAFVGDWIQLIGFSLVWGSIYGFVVSMTLFPIIAHLLTASSIPPKPNTTDFHVIQPPSKSFVWPGFKSTSRLVLVSGLIVLTLAFLSRDIKIFQGTSAVADSLLQTLIQTEATVFALVVTFSFVVIEFTNSAYTPRLARVVARQPAFIIMLALALISLTTKILVISRAIVFPELGILVDWTLLWTAGAVLGFVIFIARLFALMDPEVLIRETLRDFDTRWMDIVKDEWGGSRSIRRTIYVYQDPLWRIERILASALERGDINSFLSGLIQVRDKLSEDFGQVDRIALDAYLADSFATLIDISARQKLGRALDYLCELFEDVAQPSLGALKNADIGGFDDPPGCQLARQVLNSAIESGISSSAKTALRQLNRRARSLLEALPTYSELWLINPENNSEENVDEDRQNGYYRNDRQVNSYEDGVLRYFGEVAEQTIESNMVDVAGIATSNLSDQISGIIQKIPEEPYQYMLLMHAWFAMDKVVEAACTHQMAKVIHLGSLDFTVRAVKHTNIALMFSNKLSEYTVSLARAGILDWPFVSDVASITSELGWENPDAVLPMLDAFGKAGDYLKTLEGFSEREDLTFLLNDMHKRVDQIESSGFRGANSAKVSKAARIARKKLKV